MRTLTIALCAMTVGCATPGRLWRDGGGDTAIAVPILGRFLREKRQYAWMARRDGDRLGRRWAEFVEPRGPWTYEAKVVVAVDRFSVSMAEGFAMAMDGMKRGTVVGTRMAGLGAAIDQVEQDIPLRVVCHTTADCPAGMNCSPAKDFDELATCR